MAAQLTAPKGGNAGQWKTRARRAEVLILRLLLASRRMSSLAHDFTSLSKEDFDQKYKTKTAEQAEKLLNEAADALTKAGEGIKVEGAVRAVAADLRRGIELVQAAWEGCDPDSDGPEFAKKAEDSIRALDDLIGPSKE